ncbi:MAG: glycosyltransferase family 39 protein [Thermodesulfobacteriota bacterium]|nr:glycosyltransferase family 39 protein [Thermodesulfobacteriota bacterium]
MTQKSVTVDEIMYIAAGYYHLKTADFHLNMTNPPLMKMLSALPLLTLNLKMPSVQGDPQNWDLIDQWTYARSFLYNNIADADKILFLARLPIVALSIILGGFVFLWTKGLYGDKAALFALFLFSLSPNILAHSRLATHDLGLTAFMFISSYYFWKYLSSPTTASILLCGLFFGCALLTKTTSLFLLPIFSIYALFCVWANNGLGIHLKLPFAERVSEKRRQLRQTICIVSAFFIIVVVAIVILNIGYGFQGSFRPITDHSSNIPLYRELRTSNLFTTGLLKWVFKIPLPFPLPYTEMIGFQSNLAADSGGVYFAGNIYDAGLWYLMILTFLLKSPIPLLLLFTASLCAMAVKAFRVGPELFLLLFILVIMFVFSYLSKINMGLRYVLPIYPFIHVLASRLLSLDFMRKPLFLGLFFALSAWYLLSSLLGYPHYLAYFNESIGGPTNGYKYLSDSNLDWGQDLKGLKKYMEENHIPKIKLAYFGSADADYYGISYEYLPSVGLAPKRQGQYWWYEMDENHRHDPGPQKGYLAVSATLLASPGWMRPRFGKTYDWLKEYEPSDQIGHSILIFNIQ